MYDLVYRLLEQNLHLARTRRLAETSLWTVQLVFMTRIRGGGGDKSSDVTLYQD